jgi:hypothetical protein
VIFISKFLFVPFNALFLASVLVGVASAQESDSSGKYHPFLSDTFNIGVGVWRPKTELTIGVNDERIDGSENQSTGSLDFRWRFTKNWSFQGTYWALDTAAGATLNEDIEFGKYDPPKFFLKDSNVNAGLDTKIARLFFGRSFFRTPSTDWGVGAGIHWLQLDAFIEGDLKTDPKQDPPLTGRAEASAGVPLPNLGIWYSYSWSPKWILITRFDWLDVTIEEISGSLYDASVGFNYQMSDHFGIGLAINYFKLDVSMRDEDWKNALIDTSQTGPRLNITWNW